MNTRPAFKIIDCRQERQQAANYEATLYKYEYKNGDRISSRVLYVPRFQ